jgi:hypothetical protein
MDDKSISPLKYPNPKQALSVLRTCFFFLALAGAEQFLAATGTLIFSPWGYPLSFFAFFFPVWEYFFLIPRLKETRTQWISGWGVLLLAGTIFHPFFRLIFVFFLISLLFMEKAFSRPVFFGFLLFLAAGWIYPFSWVALFIISLFLPFKKTLFFR